MRLLGLTGNIACGKSEVARRLERLGAVVIDADLLVRELYSDPTVARGIAELFGQDALDAAGIVDRAALGRRVFGDGAALRRLEAFVHPLVAGLRERKLAELRRLPVPPSVVVIDAVKLVESGQARGCAAVWCLVCSESDQLERLETHRGLRRDEALSRLAHQPAVEGKRELLNGIPLRLIRNEGTLEALQAEVDRAWADFISAA